MDKSISPGPGVMEVIAVTSGHEWRRANVLDAAISFHGSTHTRDANCAAGDHDSCTRPAAERALDAAVAAYLGGG